MDNLSKERQTHPRACNKTDFEIYQEEFEYQIFFITLMRLLRRRQKSIGSIFRVVPAKMNDDLNQIKGMLYIWKFTLKVCDGNFYN
jgi:hypothetical protein